MNDMTYGQKKQCCQDQRNLEIVTKAGDITIERCKVCGCRHHTMIADPIEIGVKGAALGA